MVPWRRLLPQWAPRWLYPSIHLLFLLCLTFCLGFWLVWSIRCGSFVWIVQALSMWSCELLNYLSIPWLLSLSLQNLHLSLFSTATINQSQILCFQVTWHLEGIMREARREEKTREMKGTNKSHLTALLHKWTEMAKWVTVRISNGIKVNQLNWVMLC